MNINKKFAKFSPPFLDDRERPKSEKIELDEENSFFPWNLFFLMLEIFFQIDSEFLIKNFLFKRKKSISRSPTYLLKISLRNTRRK